MSVPTFYQRILIPLDGSDAADLAVPYAINLARAYRSELLLAYLVAPASPVGDSEALRLDGESFEMIKKHRAKIRSQLADEGIRFREQLIDPFVPAETLLNLIETEHVDLVIMATQGRTDMLQWVLGSGVEQKLHELPVPLLLVRPVVRTIVVPLDGSMWSQRAVPKAAELARTHNAEIVLLHVYHSPTSGYTDQLALAGQQEIADQNYEQIHEQLIALRNELRRQGLRAREQIIRSANPAQTICEFVQAEEGMCMVVMSTHGRTGLARLLLGSVAQKVVRCLRCPVTLVRPDQD